MSIIHKALLPAICIAMVAAAGCGPSPSSSASSASSAVAQAEASAAQARATASAIQARVHATSGAPKACAILDDTIATKYFGAGAHKTREAQPNPHESQCQYSGPRGQITIMAGDWSFVHTPDSDAKPVSGLGDEAYAAFSGLQVRKGDRGISISVMTESGEFWGAAADSMEAKALAAEKKVAPDLLAKL